MKTKIENEKSTDRVDIAPPVHGSAVSARERGVVVAALVLVTLLVAFDVSTDLRHGASEWHIALELIAGAVAASGAVYLLLGTLRLRHTLAQQASDLLTYRNQAESWQAQARIHVEGLARSIDRQLDRWHLSAAEKEIAFLLLKGLSLKEIAHLRGTGEKTVRAQSTAVYAKAGLTGRSELSAFFLEDLLVPAVVIRNPD